jgi:hypothetical protein
VTAATLRLHFVADAVLAGSEPAVFDRALCHARIEDCVELLTDCCETRALAPNCVLMSE